MLCEVVPIGGVEVWMHPSVTNRRWSTLRAAEILSRYTGIVERVEMFEAGEALVVHSRESKTASIRVAADAVLGCMRGFQ